MAAPGTRPRTNRKKGPPTKKNEVVIKQVLASARLGLPLKICAGRAGITPETLGQWRSKDAELDRRIEQARMEAAERAWKQIMAAGDTGLPNSWQSTAWRLERSHPESFARPEVQLGVQINQTTVNNLTITVDDAEKLQKRSRPIDAEVDKIVDTFQAKRNSADTGGPSGPTNGNHIREVEAELMPSGASTITLPPPTGRHPNWWATLSRGDGHRPITPEAARYIVQTIAVDTLGPQRASGVKIDLGDGPITLRDLWDALETFAGWQALCKRGEP
jgi:hypothetical protein